MSERLPTIPDFVRRRVQRVKQPDGRVARLITERRYSGEPVYDDGAEGHEDDHEWYYPVKGEEVVVNGWGQL